MIIEATLTETKNINCKVELMSVKIDMHKNRNYAIANFKLIDVATNEEVNIDGMNSITIDANKFKNKIIPACKGEGNLFFEVRKQIKKAFEDKGGTTTDIDDDVYVAEQEE